MYVVSVFVMVVVLRRFDIDYMVWSRQDIWYMDVYVPPVGDVCVMMRCGW